MVLPQKQKDRSMEQEHGWLRQCTEGSREELPHVRGQGQKQGGATPHPRSGEAAERSYAVSEVRGSGQECQAVTVQERPRGTTPARSQGRWLGGATPCPRSGGCEGTGGPRGAIPH